ncbi:ABC transporter ATP-binding protein [Mycoplasmatota bacterium WC44]
MLRVEKLNHSYNDGGKRNNVLKDINIEFKEGNFYAILGESGSGKTTLLSLISGLDTVQDGYIKYEGLEIKDIGYTKYRKEYINIILQSYNLINYMTALENVIVAMNIKKIKVNSRRQYAYGVLKKVGLDKEKANREVLKLSGGEQQRVAIARALVLNSKLIFADEPTGNLDEDTEKEIIKIFKNLAEDGKCVVIVTHSNNIANSADHIYKIKKGKINYVSSKAH